MASLSSGSCKISSGIWLATRRGALVFDEDARELVVVPTKRLRGFTGLLGGGRVSIPSVASMSFSDPLCESQVLNDKGHSGLGEKGLSQQLRVATFPRSHPPKSSCFRSQLSNPLTTTPADMETNLAATTAARKERLIALRKRKQAAEQGNGANGSGPYVPFPEQSTPFHHLPAHLSITYTAEEVVLRETSQIPLRVQTTKLRPRDPSTASARSGRGRRRYGRESCGGVGGADHPRGRREAEGGVGQSFRLPACDIRYRADIGGWGRTCSISNRDGRIGI